MTTGFALAQGIAKGQDSLRVYISKMLKKLREKPHHIKQILSLAFTVFIFSGILFVWVSSWDARARDKEVRGKTVSPITGVTSMFDGFVSGLKERMSGTPSFVETDGKATNTVPPVTATSTDTFDLSGVVIIDSSKAK